MISLSQSNLSSVRARFRLQCMATYASNYPISQKAVRVLKRYTGVYLERCVGSAPQTV